MKSMNYWLIGAGGVLALVLVVATYHLAIAVDDPPTGALANDSQELYAQNAPSSDPAFNRKAVYDELKRLGKQYRQARQEDAKQRIRVRAEELVGQLMDAKIQAEQRHISDMEIKLDAAKERLHNLQLHKADTIHQGVQRALEKGELPEFEKNQSRME